MFKPYHYEKVSVKPVNFTLYVTIKYVWNISHMEERNGDMGQPSNSAQVSRLGITICNLS